MLKILRCDTAKILLLKLNLMKTTFLFLLFLFYQTIGFSQNLQENIEIEKNTFYVWEELNFENRVSSNKIVNKIILKNKVKYDFGKIIHQEMTAISIYLSFPTLLFKILVLFNNYINSILNSNI